MRYIFLMLISLLVLFACNQNEKSLKNDKDIFSTEYFSIPTNLKTLRNIKKEIISDSLIKISGNFNHYFVQGFINESGQRINWWKIIDSKNDEGYNVRLEYRIVENKEKVNQFILYNKNGDYVLKSKFYLRKKLDKLGEIYEYSFFTPSNSPKKNLLKKFNYTLFVNNKEIKSDDLECKEIDNYFLVNVKIPKSKEKIILKGLFTELFEDNKKPGLNEIYVLDTLAP